MSNRTLKREERQIRIQKMLEIYSEISRLVYRQYNGKCFFTGITLQRDIEIKHPLRATVEHLIPKVFGVDQYVGRNTVLAGYSINHSVANSPISVKFMLKEELKLMDFNQWDNDTVRMHKALAATTRFLNRFRYHSSFPWEWRGICNNSALRQKLFTRYLELLTKEEYELLKKIKREKPIYFELMEWL